MKACFMFPGQGTQKPGMLRALGNQAGIADDIFHIAREVTGRDIKELCLTAGEEELQRTENTQLAVTAMNLSYLALLQREGIEPYAALGHSLGQFSALAAARVLTVEQVFLLVQKRAQLMSKIQHSGMLCSVVGMDLRTVRELCSHLDPSADNLVVALYNTQNQIVIGGDSRLVLKAEDMCKEKGALRTVAIRVSHAFHTPLMREMEEEYAAFIDTVSFSTPQCRLALNCKGDFADGIMDIKAEIKNQCCHTVLWYDSVKKVIDLPDEMIFAETGVGKVLTGMMRSIDRRQAAYMMSDPAQFDRFIKLVKE